MRLGVLRAELVAHDLRPDAPGRTELRDLLEQRRARDEEERQARGEVVDVEAGVDRRLHVRLGVGDGERHLLRGRRAGLGHVVARDGDGVPARKLLAAVGERVGDQPQRLLRRVDVGAAGDVLLQHVVLDRAGELGALDALLLGDELVEQQQHRARRVDRHGRRHLAERDAAEQHAHVVDRVDRDAHLADLAVRDRLVGVVAHLRRQVEGDAEAAGACGDELVVALVGLLGGAEPGVLAHGPRAAGVHVRVHAAGVRELAGLAELLGGVPALQGVRTVDRADREAGLAAGFAHSREGSRARAAEARARG